MKTFCPFQGSCSRYERFAARSRGQILRDFFYSFIYVKGVEHTAALYC